MWATYSRKGTIEARAYIVGESLKNISVSKYDLPSEGGMICRNPVDHNDQWYVNKEYFDKHYEISNS